MDKVGTGIGWWWWLLALLIVFTCTLVNCEEELSVTEGDDDDGGALQVNYENFNDYPLFEIDPQMKDKFGIGFQPNSGGVMVRKRTVPFLKSKRAIFGILGLATKRPHKTAAEIQHLPPEDAFLPLRGKKRSSSSSGLGRQMLLPSSSLLLRTAYPVMSDSGWGNGARNQVYEPKP